MDRIEAFFARLGETAHEPMLRRVTGRLRFDLDGHSPDHWLLVIEGGRIDVTRSAGPATCVVRTTGELFERIVTGEANPLTARLRGDLTVEGDLALLRLFERSLPGPPDARDPRVFVAQKAAARE
ncbi:SCP2 sterol-binding domain-containing protein [Plantactinospora sp. WMMB782]|uniref:SCP2 sterol-binding domain-containing protein n=1 Tax=Plantactinospora sp. WMMB782 TaxID=3404121 RepID=UPI003B93DA0D